MAISIDATSSGATTASSLTVSHTCAVGATLLVVTVLMINNNFSSATYNGAAMSFVEAGNQGNTNVIILTRNAPASGTHDIVINATGSTNMALGAASILGAYTIGSHSNNSGTSATASITATTANTSGFVFAGACFNDITIAYTGAGTQIYNATKFGAVYQAYASSANPAQTWTSTSSDWSTAYLEVSNVAASSGFFMAASR